MKDKINTLDTSYQRQSKDSVFVDGKQLNAINLTNRQQKVFDLLRTGKRSVTQITIATGFSDPRGYIRDLRAKGIAVLDEWIIKDDTRFKLYFIKQ